MQKLIKINLLLVLIIPLLLGGCKKSSHEKRQNLAVEGRVFTVKSEAFRNDLYFASRVKPLSCQPLTSPVDGIVTQKSFQYGEKVNAGSLLLVIESMKEQTDYQAALAKYFQANQDYSRSQQEYENDQKLWEKGIVAKEVYDNAQRSYLTSRLNLLQSEAGFKKFLKSANDLKSLEQLSMSNIDAVDQALQLDKLTREINVYANNNGLAIFAAKNQEEGKTINVGDEVKTGQMLLCIASSEGISLEIRIGEVNVHQIFVGQKATVTFDAMPSVTLEGYVESVEAQAKGSEQLPTFSGVVVVQKMTPEALKLIMIGMSAKIDIEVKHKPSVLIPVVAVDHYLDQTKVKMMDPISGKIKEVLIETGETTFDKVEVISGLKEGDQVIVPN